MVWHYFMTRFSVLFFSGLIISCSSMAKDVTFSRKQIVLEGKTLKVEVAETNTQRERGLMNRTSLEKNSGMMFIFDRPRTLSFWMKNTLIPLDIGFFDKDKKLLNVESMHPPKSVMVQDHQLERYSSKGPAKYALEMNIGWFKANKIEKGARFHWKTNPE